MFSQFGKWMTKVGALLIVTPQIGNLIGNAMNNHDAITPSLASALTALGTVLGLLGIRRAIK